MTGLPPKIYALGDDYPWKFYVNQRSGEKIVSQTRADGVPDDMRRRG
jgi:hypothetical protein